MDSTHKSRLSEFIQQTIPHIGIQPDALELIAAQFEVHDLYKNEYILKEGKISNYYIVLDGFLRSYTFDKEGNEVTTSFYGGMRVIFEPASFFQHKPSTENIQAITNCKGYISTFEKLNVLFHSTPAFREFARAIIIKEFVAYKNQTSSMINKSAEERYLDLIRNHQEIFQHAQLKHIASFLGITDTSLSRIRSKLTKK